MCRVLRFFLEEPSAALRLAFVRADLDRVAKAWR